MSYINIDGSQSTLTVVNVSRNGRGALYKPLKLLTLKTRKIQLNRPFKVLHSHHLPTDMRYLHWQHTKTLESDDRIQTKKSRNRKFVNLLTD